MSAATCRGCGGPTADSLVYCDDCYRKGGRTDSAAKPSVIGWGWRWQSDWVPWFERGPEPFVWRLNIGPLHIVRITERAARGDLSGI